MDFNTGGRSGGPDDRPLYGGESRRPAGDPTRGPGGGTGGEFNLQDPIPSFVDTVRRVVLDPVGFFRGVPRQGNFINPLVFALICALISALLSGIIGLAISPLFAGPGDTAGQALTGGVVGLLVSLILTPIYVAITLFIGAAITHLLVMLLIKPQNAGFEATFRVAAYAQVIQLINWIPVIGSIIALVWGIVLSILGIREVHSTTTGRAALVVLIPVVVILLLVILLATLIGAALFFGAQQQP